jgi:HK97 family phage major capsid protein
MDINEILEAKAKEIEKMNSQTNQKINDLTAKFDDFQSKTAERSEIEGIKSELGECKSELLKLSRNNGVQSMTTEMKAEAWSKRVSDILRKNRTEHAEFDSAVLGTKEDPSQGQTGVDALGGYAVPFALDRKILSKVRDLNVMRRLCSSQSVSTPETYWNVDLGGTDAGWVGELTPRPNTNVPQLARAGITWGEIYANPKASYRLLDDALFNVEAWYSQKVAETFADYEEEAFLTGNGTNKPKGLLAYDFASTADATRDFGTFQKIESATLTADAIIDLYYSLRQVYRGNNTAWLMNPSTIQALRKLKDGNQNYIWIDNIANGMVGTLLGRPVYESRFMPDFSTAGNKAILFGDFKKAYTIFDLHGLRIVRDVYTDKTSVQFYTSKRVGNMVQDSCAIKCLAKGA